MGFLKYLLKLNIRIGKKLTYLIAKYETKEEIRKATKTGDFDIRNVSERLKNVIIHDEDIIKKRWDICKACPELTNLNRCKQWGCFMKVKTKIATAKCPIGKWDKEYEFIKGRAVNGTNPST